MDKQAAIQKAWNGLKVQGCRGFDSSENTCFYSKVIDGREVRCAVGHLFTGPVPALICEENASVEGLALTPGAAGALGVESGADWEFLADLQLAHDSVQTDPYFARTDHSSALDIVFQNLQAVAQKYGLTLEP